MNTRIETIWRDLSPFMVGFDRTFDTLSILANSKAQNTNYPPYNIRKLPEDKYSIELAVAGFDEKDIDIEVSEQNLTIDGKKSDEMNENLIHQGLASRNFNRKFVFVLTLPPSSKSKISDQPPAKPPLAASAPAADSRDSRQGKCSQVSFLLQDRKLKL